MSSGKVVIVDYQLGNMFSVRHACRHVGMNVEVSSNPAVIREASALILPGVGAFGEAIEHMSQLGLIEAVRASVENGKPLFGVCLGLQLLFSRSEEFGETEGLGIIPGTVRKFPGWSPDNSERIKVPQIGWNRIKPPKNSEWDGTPLEVCTPGDHVYFVHSFMGIPDRSENILSLTNYRGVEYCSAVRFGENMIATQFHPEKSGKKGLRIYENWARASQLI
jgi:imidazole glycerol-phosphate synthase subunit HisH